MSHNRRPSGSIVKVVGVSDDHNLITKMTNEIREAFGDKVTAEASQPYYLDITHPLANKGAVVSYLAECYELATDQIATIGDMPNDVEMFTNSGLAIAMGNAESDVQHAADLVTTSNSAEGFAHAMERFVLGRDAAND
jgi:hydroxymethylpyrimidine pyrophosphatase-like HAD family hydrolase